MNLLIYASFLGHLRYIEDSSKKRYIEDKLFVRNVRNKF